VPASPRARWGWHRLTDSWADTIVADAAVRRGELVLDVGAGEGAITAALTRAGAHVIAVELHPGRVQVLQRRFAGAPVTVVRADVADLRLPRRPFRVVANPPFAATTQLLRRLLSPGSRMYAADLVLQRAAARRWAGPNAPASGRWHRVYDAQLGRRVPRRAFVPHPPVDAAVLALRDRVGARQLRT
jgi:23S rRNA (adenine-N6)-dimethyltransferase